MKTGKNIMIAFILNLAFSLFEFVGGVWTGSVAIISDALHDLGDAVGIGISVLFEEKSKQQPDEAYTYGYGRYSVLGGVITTMILLVGSAFVIFRAVERLFHPEVINYNGMIVFAVFGLVVNFCAAFVTREGDSINQKAVNLHMLEDVLGWVVILVGAVAMRFTGFAILDPLMSMGVALFIIAHAVKNLREALGIFLEKTPHGIHAEVMKKHICEVSDVLDVHHVHIWSVDETMTCATMHIVTNGDPVRVKEAVREELNEFGISHVILELEGDTESCSAKECRREHRGWGGHHHHHGHHDHDHDHH